MKPKLKEKQRARKLRKQGLSYKKILQKVPVSKGSVSLWCQDIKLTPKQKTRLENNQKENHRKGVKLGLRSMALKRKKEIDKIRKAAKAEIRPLTPYEFKIAGAMMYWGEGSKSNGVEIANADPKIVKFMIQWLKKSCNISHEKIKARINIHKNQSDLEVKKYWSKLTCIPLESFWKSYIKPDGTGHRKKILPNGVIKVRAGGEDLRHKIMGWIEGVTAKA